MDDLLFRKCLEGFEFVPEDMKYLEILNYQGQEPKCHDSEVHKLSIHDLDNFLHRKGVFASPTLDGVTNGIRLVIQDDVQGATAFNHNVMSFAEPHYVSLVSSMNLPPQAVESSSVVGPFFWWGLCRDPADKENKFLQLVFRKSDVRWKGTSRGWEMALSYSFRAKITSGYVRGTKSAGIIDIMESLSAACAKEVAVHPLLLPLLMLEAGLAPTTEINQRQIRDRLRDLESAMGGDRYNMAPAEGYGPETDIMLDKINRELADLQCKVMWKRPQVWQGAVGRLKDATGCFWERLSDQDREIKGLEDLQATIQRRLDFASVRLDGLESYIQVSLERLDIQREVMNSFISQRESRLSLSIAAQQQRLAQLAGRESTSMKTLTLLGAVFLPSALVSSIFGMSFFDFVDENGGSVSSRVWIYFAICIPLTAVIVGTWWTVDRRRLKQASAEVSDQEMSRLEGRIMKAIRRRTGARVMSEGAHVVHSDELRRQEYAGFEKVDVRGGKRARMLERVMPWRQRGVGASEDGV
ncbi:hypothetical protein B0T16DRAFT_495437 [Cercophora newfieldiana]|uniref:CTF/NF-I domain-containing protein n=1 Tax=Cercophora newfieldiana TaxID=92897 RepID=A0AA40CN53_9PEZI|nr:hypothetical protein B0T16DRAFT_495437 [Cercophora newfieldiana]